MEKYIEYKENLCFRCLKEYDDIKVYTLSNRGYGSIYDCCVTKLQLCKCCREGVDSDLNKWFYECPYNDTVGYRENYKYEENISKYIDSLPVQGRELFDNQMMDGALCHQLPSQDWIDIELGVATDSIYTRNNLYSPSEIKAYKDRFPKCNNTYIQEYSDGSSHSLCKVHKGVTGDKNGNANDYNYSSNCYYCDSFKLRGEPIKTESVKPIELREVVMLEGFCPTCGNRYLKHKDKILYGYSNTDFCGNCYQELSIDLSECEEDEK